MEKPFQSLKRYIFSLPLLLLFQKCLLRLDGFEGLISLPLFQEIFWNQRDLFTLLSVRHIRVLHSFFLKIDSSAQFVNQVEIFY